MIIARDADSMLRSITNKHRYSLTFTVGVNLRSMKWAGHVARMVMVRINAAI